MTVNIGKNVSVGPNVYINGKPANEDPVKKDTPPKASQSDSEKDEKQEGLGSALG